MSRQDNAAWLSDALEEIIDETLDLLGEFAREEMSVGLLEEIVPQRKVKAAFEAVLGLDGAEFEQAAAEFEQVYGSDVWQREMRRRVSREVDTDGV